MAAISTSVSASGGLTFDLTALGSADWIAYNNGAQLRKNVTAALAVAQISGSGGQVAFARATSATLNYSDGVSPASGSTQGGVYVTNAGVSTKGWVYTAPADLTLRRLRVYAGIYQGAGIKLTATLSDGSAPEVIDTSFAYISGADPRTGEYIIDYSAASAGQTLTVLVQAVNAGTLSVQGGALGAAPVVAAPDAPTIGTAVGGSQSASVGGSAPASNGGSPITGYRATSTPGGITGTSASLPVAVTGLTDGTSYTFTLAAQNSAGYGPESAASNSVTPSSANNVPVFSGSVPNIGGQSGVAITSVDASANFADTDALTYSASPAGTAWPSGLVINSTTGVISGTLSAGTTTGLRVRATDTASQTVDSNAFSVTIASGATQVPHTDAAILYSPYSWDDRGAYKSANAPGAYARLTFSGTSVTANFDVSALVAASAAAGDYPLVRVVIDGKTATEKQLTSASPVVAITGLSAGSHTVDVFFRAINVNAADRWGGAADAQPVSALLLSGFTLEAGATYSAPVARSKRMLFFGDSITEGYYAISNGNPGGNSSQQTVPVFLAPALDCEFGQIGYSAQGYAKTGNGGVPTLTSAIPFYSNGRSRLVGGLLSPAPDYVCVMHGANGTNSATAVQSTIDIIRAAAPAARIFIMVPAGGYGRSAIAAGVAARSADANLAMIDLGAAYQPGMDNSGSGGQYSNDGGLHPNLLGNARAAAGYASKIQSVIDGAAQVAPPALTARTVSLSLGTVAGVAANLTGLRVSFHDEPTPDATTVPRYQSAVETTDAAGILAFVANSTLPAGGTGHLTVLGAADVHYNGPVQVS